MNIFGKCKPFFLSKGRGIFYKKRNICISVYIFSLCSTKNKKFHRFEVFQDDSRYLLNHLFLVREMLSYGPIPSLMLFSESHKNQSISMPNTAPCIGQILSRRPFLSYHLLSMLGLIRLYRHILLFFRLPQDFVLLRRIQRFVPSMRLME